MIDWQKIAEIALTCIASVGGVGAIIVGVVKFGGDKIAERLSMKYQLQLDKEKERYKTELSKKTYISKTRFDAEFRMYQELSEKNIAAVYCTGEAVMMMRGATCDEEGTLYSAEEIKQFIARFCDTINDTSKANRRYAPFISKEMHDKFFSIEKKADEIFTLTKAWKDYYAGETFLFSTHGSEYQNQKEVEIAVEKKHKVLSDELKTLTDDLRDYLSKLDVTEEA